MKTVHLPKLRYLSLGMLVAVFLCGCYALSLHPFYNDADLLSQPNLAGEWVDSNGGEGAWRFEKINDEEKGYLLTITEGDKKMLSKAHLFKVRDQLFLNVFTGGEWKEDVFPPALPTHTVFRVDKTGTSLQLRLWDFEWLSKYLADNPKAIAHEVIQGKGGSKEKFPVLTAKTPELQKFLIDHLNDAKAWGNEIKLDRKK